jgi:hypothetical protein
MMERTLGIVGPGRTTAFVQVTAAKLREGILREAAAPIAATGLQKVILRVRDIGEGVQGEDLHALLDALDTYTAAGFEVIVDCAGRLGPLLAHQGAAGFSTGPMYFRKVAQALLAIGGGGGGSALRYEEYGAWRWVDRGEISKLGLACPVAGCKAVSGCELDDIREHNLHALRRLAGEVSSWGAPELIASLRKSGDRVAAGWANVLARRLQRASEGQSGGFAP